jgi:hypothetical protein
MTDPTREELGDLLRRLVDTAVQMKDRAERAEAQLATARADAVREAADVASPWGSCGCSQDILALIDHPAPAPSPEAVARAALGAARDACVPHEDDDGLDRQAKAECSDAIYALERSPATLAAIIDKAQEGRP